MDPDRLAALCRGYFKRDFTGWHDFSGRMFMLDCGGFRITYDGNFHVRITDDKVDADLEIGGVTVDRDCIEISDGGFEDHAWMLTAEREKGRPTVMSGAPLRRPIDRDRWDGTYYNRSWPEVAIARPMANDSEIFSDLNSADLSISCASRYSSGAMNSTMNSSGSRSVSGKNGR